MMECGRFRMSMNRLGEPNRNHRQGSPMLSDPDRERIAKSAVQSFKTRCDGL